MPYTGINNAFFFSVANSFVGDLRSSGTQNTSPLEALLSGQLGPITSEGLFLVRCDLMEQQNLKIAQKTAEFREQTALQEKYAEFLNWMQTAQSMATGNGGELLVISKIDENGEPIETEGGIDLHQMLQGMGYEEPYLSQMLQDIMAYQEKAKIGDDQFYVLSPEALANFLNNHIFGPENQHLYIHLDELKYVSDDEGYTGTFSKDDFANVTEKIDASQKENCVDTTLLTTELNQLVSHQERISNMFSNLLKKFHDTEMAIIRNI